MGATCAMPDAGEGKRRHRAGRAARAPAAIVCALVVCSALAGASAPPGRQSTSGSSGPRSASTLAHHLNAGAQEWHRGPSTRTGHRGTAQVQGRPGSAALATAFSLVLSISCPGAADCWAVGHHQDTSTRTFRLVEHWNGVTWRIVDVPSPPGARHSELSGISCASVRRCWAVGSYSLQSGSSFAYAERWNGRQWAAVTVPRPLGALTSDLSRVSCVSAVSCWAVGSASSGPPGAGGLTEHWNGHAWSVVPSPHVRVPGFLAGVSCLSDTDCWAVGQTGNGSLTEHWNGSAWSVVKTPTSGKNFDTLGDVSCSAAAACMAVTDLLSSDTFAQRWNGSKWVVTPVVLVGNFPTLGGVSCTGPSRCWAVGWYMTGTSAKPLAERWNGTSWKRVAIPSPSDATSSQAFGVTCLTARNCWAGGVQVKTSHAELALFEHWNGTKWSVVG